METFGEYKMIEPENNNNEHNRSEDFEYENYKVREAEEEEESKDLKNSIKINEDEENEEDDEGINISHAMIGGTSTIKIILQVLGVIILIIAVVALGYFQLRDLNLTQEKISTELYVYNTSCNDVGCVYLIKDSLPNSLNCSYKGNETDCSNLKFEMKLNGTKSCINGDCIIKTIETVDKCFKEGWIINCNEIEVKRYVK